MARPDARRAAAAALVIAATVALAATSGSPGPPRRAAGAHATRLGTARAASAPTPGGPVPTPRPSSVVPAGRPVIRVPILEYHYIRINPDPRDVLGFNLSVTPADFRAQLDWLDANGYHPVTISALRDYFAERRPLPAKPVVLSFDDGHQDFYTTAWPALSAHHFTAVSFVIPGFFGRRDYMTPDQVRRLDRAGVEIGSHTVHHVDLTTLGPADLEVELEASKGALEQLLGHPVLDFCYPSGRFDQAVIAAVQRAGYQSATSELPGVAHSWSDRFTWSRVRVMGGETLPSFVASLGTPEPSAVTATRT
jgi:peptidoglycan/xylan/chitin deacetylase (PgdA/CDA1 family)